jgi:hypothetical protein
MDIERSTGSLGANHKEEFWEAGRDKLTRLGNGWSNDVSLLLRLRRNVIYMYFEQVGNWKLIPNYSQLS